VLTNMALDVVVGATQASNRVTFTGFTPSGLAFGIFREGFAEVADLRRGFNWQGEVMIGGGGIDERILSMSCVYSAGVAANSFTIGIFGYVIPRGNIAPF